MVCSFVDFLFIDNSDPRFVYIHRNYQPWGDFYIADNGEAIMQKIEFAFDLYTCQRKDLRGVPGIAIGWYAYAQNPMLLGDCTGQLDLARYNNPTFNVDFSVATPVTNTLDYYPFTHNLLNNIGGVLYVKSH